MKGIDMNRDEIQELIRDYIRDNLTVEVDTGWHYGSYRVTVRLVLDSETISTSYDTISPIES